MNEIECETCIKRKTKYCPNSSECYENIDKPYYQNRIMLLEENEQLKGSLQTYEILLKANVEENQKYKEVIDKAIMYTNSTRYSDINGLKKYSIKEFWFVKELKDILKEVE